jgi:hypothetical protein
MRPHLKRLVAVSVCAFLMFVLFSLARNESEPFSNDKSTCENLQKPEDVTINNIIWQVLETSDGRVNLLNAYLDERWNKTVVSINANGPNLNVSYHKVYCQFWFENIEQPLVVQVSEFRTMYLGGLTGKFSLNVV